MEDLIKWGHPYADRTRSSEYMAQYPVQPEIVCINDTFYNLSHLERVVRDQDVPAIQLGQVHEFCRNSHRVNESIKPSRIAEMQGFMLRNPNVPPAIVKDFGEIIFNYPAVQFYAHSLIENRALSLLYAEDPFLFSNFSLLMLLHIQRILVDREKTRVNNLRGAEDTRRHSVMSRPLTISGLPLPPLRDGVKPTWDDILLDIVHGEIAKIENSRVFHVSMQSTNHTSDLPLLCKLAYVSPVREGSGVLGNLAVFKRADVSRMNVFHAMELTKGWYASLKSVSRPPLPAFW